MNPMQLLKRRRGVRRERAGADVPDVSPFCSHLCPFTESKEDLYSREVNRGAINSCNDLFSLRDTISDFRSDRYSSENDLLLACYNDFEGTGHHC